MGSISFPRHHLVTLEDLAAEVLERRGASARPETPDVVRREIALAMSAAVDPALAPPQLRTAIMMTGRDLCQPLYLEAFEQIAPQLDEHGTRFPPQRKMPLHAVQAVRRTLFDAKTDVIERAAHDAIDRAKQVLLRESADAAARLDQPITHRLTPRDVAIRRLAELRIPKPDDVVTSLLASLSELAQLAWEEPEPSARAYSPRESFDVGDLIDHPQFGRGTVQAMWERSVEVEFEDGSWRTLVHGRAR